MLKLLLTGILTIFFATTPLFGQSQSDQLGQLSIYSKSKSIKNPEIDGKTIRSIAISLKDVFEGKDLKFVYRTANKLKVNTKIAVIKRELLFDVGDKLDPFLMQESERLLRSLKYLNKVKITGKADGEFVDILVSAQDTWTLIPQVNVSQGDGKNRTSAGLQESNLIGLGKRIEVLYSQEQNRDAIEGVYDDRRVMGSDIQMLGAAFNRNDGDKYLLSVGKPFRSLIDKNSYAFDINDADTIGRLFEGGDERFIYRQKISDIGFGYSISRGNPIKRTRRYTFGWEYQDIVFSEADQDDFDDLDLDPNDLNQDPSQLAENRRFSGPTFKYQRISPDFIPMNYIDRFDRVEDFNLGRQDTVTLQVAPEAFGSRTDALLFSGTANNGWRISNKSFFRAELALSSRLEDDSLVNKLARTELKYYKLLGSKYFRNIFLGNHTIATSFFIDFGSDLDKDREFTIGADNALRGYDARTFTGDKRLALNIEDRVHIVENVLKLVNIGAAVFFETGGASNENFGDLIADDIYADFGLGLRLSFPRSSGSRILRFDVALPLRDGPDGSGSFEPRFLVSGGQLFSAYLRSEVVGAERASVDVGFDR